MGKHELYQLIFKAWNDLIERENFRFRPEQSTRYLCWIENDYCAIEIKIERFYDRFDIGFYNLQEKRKFPRSIFSLLEVVHEADSEFHGHLLPVSSIRNKKRYFYQRFFLNKPYERFSDFNALLLFFKQIILNKFQPLLKGDFELFEMLKAHFKSNLKTQAGLSTQEKVNLQKDFERFCQSHKGPFKFPEKKIIEEIKKPIKISKGILEHKQYQISEEEKEWLDSMDKMKESFGKPLSLEYISSFEKIHEIELPRDYKLFLNYIGNGFSRFRTLEQALISNEDSTSAECFDFIDLTKEFKVQEQSQLSSNSGYLRIYDYGCGIVHYLVVKGTGYGKIWYQNPDFGDIVQKFPDYDTWIDSFRAFLNEVIDR